MWILALVIVYLLVGTFSSGVLSAGYKGDYEILVAVTILFFWPFVLIGVLALLIFELGLRIGGHKP